MPILGQAKPPLRADNIVGILSLCHPSMDEELPIDPSFFDVENHMREERTKIVRHNLKSRVIMAFAVLAFAALIAWAVAYHDTVLFSVP